MLGFRVRPEDEALGFRMTLRDFVPGFNLDENGAPRLEANWSGGMPAGSTPQYANFAQTPASQIVGLFTPNSGSFVQSEPPTLPDWLYKLVTMPLPKMATVLDPRTGRRIVPFTPLINRAAFNPTEDQNVPETRDTGVDVSEPTLPPASGPVETKPTEERPPLDTAADINAPTGGAVAQKANVPPAATETMWNAGFQPLSGREPYPQAGAWEFQRPWLPELAQQATRIPLAQWTGPAGSNLVLPTTGSGWQGRPPPQAQPTQQKMPAIVPEARPITSPAAAPMPPGVAVGDLELRRARELAQLPQKEISGEPSRQQFQNGSASSSNDVPLLGQNLLQSSVETLVPGAHYQQLARQQFDAGNYIAASAYQAAALADAALGVATLGMSTRLGAAGRTAAAEGAALFRRAFESFDQLKRYLGRAPEGMQWHHIVEQSQIPQFGAQRIHSVENIVAIPTDVHERLNAFYASKKRFSDPNRVREWLRGQSYEEQYEFGMRQLKEALGY